MWIDPGIRDYYAEPLPAIYDCFMRSKVTQGSMIWCWADDIFCVPGRGLEYGRGTTKVHFIEPQYRLRGRGLVGDSPWGVVDGWRREKPEYWIVKKLHSPIRIQEKTLAWPTEDDAICIPVENQYYFTNLKELKILWTLNGESGTVSSDIPPRSIGELLIRINSNPQHGTILKLEFFDVYNRLIDAFQLPIGEKPDKFPGFSEETTPLRIRHEDVLAGRSTVVEGKDFELGFDHGGGYVDFGGGFLRRSVAFGESFLMDLPTIHLLPADAPESPIPNRLDWKKEHLNIRHRGQRRGSAARRQLSRFKGELPPPHQAYSRDHRGRFICLQRPEHDCPGSRPEIVCTEGLRPTAVGSKCRVERLSGRSYRTAQGKRSRVCRARRTTAAHVALVTGQHTSGQQ
ncbi:MAG: hypothetical protein ABIL68_04610 [bacterium]